MRIQRVWSFLAIASMVFASFAVAQDTGFNAASGDWDVAGNWTTGAVPTAGNGNVYVGASNGPAGTTTVANVDLDNVLAVPNQTVGELRIGSGDGANGTLNMSTGTLTSNGWTFVGLDASGAAASGTFNLSGGDFISGDAFIMGVGGGTGANTGTLNISGGTFTGNSGISVGRNDGNTGIINQSGGTVTANAWLAVGNEGANGQYNMTGGSLIMTSPDFFLSIGDNFVGPGSTGVMNISGNSTVDASSAAGINVGANPGGIGFVNIDGSGATILASNFLAATDPTGTALDSEAHLSWTSDATGVSSIVVSGLTALNPNIPLPGPGGPGTSTLAVDLTDHSAFGAMGSGSNEVEFILIDNAAMTIGQFAGLGEGALINIGGGKTGILSYVGGDGDDISVTVSVPEPSSIVLLGLAAVGIASRRRRK